MTRKFLFGLSFIVCLGMGGQVVSAMQLVEEDEGRKDFRAGFACRERAQDEQKNMASMLLLYQTIVYGELDRISERQKSDRHAFPAWEFAKQDEIYKKAYAGEIFKKLIRFFPLDYSMFVFACDWYLKIVRDDMEEHYQGSPLSDPLRRSSPRETVRRYRDVIRMRTARLNVSCSSKVQSKYEKEKFEKIRDLVFFMIQDPKQRFIQELVQDLRTIARDEVKKD